MFTSFKRVLPIALCFGIAPSLCRADGLGERAGQANAEPKAVMPDVYFARIKDDLRNLMPLDISGEGRLVINRKVWEFLKSKTKSREERLAEITSEVRQRWNDPNEESVNRQAKILLDSERPDERFETPAFLALYKKLGGGFSRSSEHRTLVYDFSSGTMWGSLILRDPKEVVIRLSDVSEIMQPAYLSVLDNGYGKFSLSLFLGERGPYLVIAQNRTGSIVVDILWNGVHSSRRAGSFDELLTNDEKYLRNEVLPILAHVGIRPPPVLDPVMIESVMKLLENPGAIPPATEIDLAAGLGLQNDPGFLSSVLLRVENEKHSELIVKKLETLTGQSLGRNYAAWRTWWKENGDDWQEKNAAQKKSTADTDWGAWDAGN